MQICVFKTWNLFSETMFLRAVGGNYIDFPKTGAVKHLLGIWVGGKIKSFERYRDVIGAWSIILQKNEIGFCNSFQDMCKKPSSILRMAADKARGGSLIVLNLKI